MCQRPTKLSSFLLLHPCWAVIIIVRPLIESKLVPGSALQKENTVQQCTWRPYRAQRLQRHFWFTCFPQTVQATFALVEDIDCNLVLHPLTTRHGDWISHYHRERVQEKAWGIAPKGFYFKSNQPQLLANHVTAIASIVQFSLKCEGDLLWFICLWIMATIYGIYKKKLIVLLQENKIQTVKWMAIERRMTMFAFQDNRIKSIIEKHS